MFVFLTGCSGGTVQDSGGDSGGAPPITAEGGEQTGTEELIPLTTANLRGHKSLYNEGWFIVTSSRDALDYAYQHSVLTSGEALSQAKQDISRRTAGVAPALKEDVSSGAETAAAVHRVGARFRETVRAGGHAAGARQVDYGLEQLGKSWSFVTGGIYYGPRAQEHWSALKGTWPAYYGNLEQDFSNILELNHRAAGALATEIEADWEGAFDEAALAFREEYEASGQRGNSLEALGDILVGYLKAFYEGVARPSGRSMVIAASGSAQAGSYLFTPTAGFVSVVGRTVQSTGLSLYYATRTGIDILSPTIEAGFLTGLGVLSLGTGAATHLGGETLGAVSQVALSGAGGVAGVTQGAAQAAATTGQYVALVTYDAGKAATKVVFNQARSGVVLGYNALTAIPAHLLIGVPSAAIFLAYEGPKLVLVRAREKLDGQGQDGESSNLGDLPVGTVVDLEELEKRKDVEVEVISDDPAVTGRALEAVQRDLNAQGGKE